MIRMVVLAILLTMVSACASSPAEDDGASPRRTAPVSSITTTSTTSTTARGPEPTDAPTTTSLPAPNGVNADSPCLARAIFGNPAESEYLLPYPAGDEFYLSQSYCFSEGGHSNQLAYDFDMPVGTPVLAARGGIVKTTRSDSPDNGEGYGEHNYVFIQHEDGTVAFYAHLMQDGVMVEYGDVVEAGELIGYSGNSGLTGNRPHLHFGVYLDWPPREGRDVPVNFRNASGQHDSRGGLAVWRLFEALPVD